MRFIAWLLSVIFAFSLGVNGVPEPKESDSELRRKVQEHIDVIVDESAAIVDDVTESIRNDPRVQDTEQFIQDVQEVTEETLDDLNQVLDNARDRVDQKFGTGAAETPEEDAEDVAEAVEEEADIEDLEEESAEQEETAADVEA